MTPSALWMIHVRLVRLLAPPPLLKRILIRRNLLQPTRLTPKRLRQSFTLRHLFLESRSNARIRRVPDHKFIPRLVRPSLGARSRANDDRRASPRRRARRNAGRIHHSRRRRHHRRRHRRLREHRPRELAANSAAWSPRLWLRALKAKLNCKRANCERECATSAHASIELSDAQRGIDDDDACGDAGRSDARVIGEFVGEFVGEFASIARGLRGECSECVATIEGIATRGEGCSMPDDEEEWWC